MKRTRIHHVAPLLLVVLCCQAESGVDPGGAGTAGAAPAGAAGAAIDAGGSSAGGGGGSGGAGTVASAGQAGAAGAAGLTGAAGSGGSLEQPPIEECPGKPSVDRLTEWIASGEGTTIPATGSILVEEGARYVGRVQLVGSGWHVIPVYIKNRFGETQDLSASSGFTLTYSASAELHVQLRSESHWSGGDQYATTIPATGGEKQTRFFPFAAAEWQSLFGPPSLSYADTLKQGMGLVFVGEGENQIVFYGLRIDGYTPPCP